MPVDLANAPAFAKDPAFTVGLATDPTFLTNLEIALDARYANSNAMSMVASASSAVDQIGIGAADTALTNLSMTFTAVAGRKYVLMYSIQCTQTVALGLQVLSWMLAGVPQATIDAYTANLNTTRPAAGFTFLGALGAGSKTIGLAGRTGAGNLAIPSGTTNNGRVAVFDVGV